LSSMRVEQTHSDEENLLDYSHLPYSWDWLIVESFRDAINAFPTGGFEYIDFAITDWSMEERFIGPLSIGFNGHT